MAKSKTRLIAEFMRGVQTDENNNAVHSEVQATADVYAMFDDAPQSLKDKWYPYRQALRDITNQEDLDNIIWPDKPE